MTINDLANLLDGRQRGEEITRQEELIAEGNGFIVIYGASDDLCEIAGAVHDELGCFDGGEFYLYNGNAVSIDECTDENYRVKVIWEPEGKNCSWAYETPLPHAEFKIYEGDELYCIGIVVDIKSTYPPKTTETRLDNDVLICPYCGEEQYDHEPDVIDADCANTVCECCGDLFWYSVRVSRSYSVFEDSRFGTER